MNIDNKNMRPFDKYLQKWQLTQEGEPIITRTSQLLPVSYKNLHSMLKIAHSEEERNGAALMIWWNGDGAAQVFEHEDDALLMERAIGQRSLINMAKSGHDDEASKIICEVVAKLHAKKHKTFPTTLVPLNNRFESLRTAAQKKSGIFSEALSVANELLKNPQDIVSLHGDIHHQNILDSGVHGWIAIDPKGLIGERGFDYANIFCNPDFEIATQTGRLAKQSSLVAEAANLDRYRLIQWIFAYSGLSAAWSLEEGDSPDLALAVANIAKAELGI